MNIKLNNSLKRFLTASIIMSLILISLNNVTFAQTSDENTEATVDKNTEQTQNKPEIKPKEIKNFTPDNKTGASPFSSKNTKQVPDNSQLKLNTPPVVPKVEELKTENTGGNVQSPLIDANNPIGLAQPYFLLQQSLELLKKKDVTAAKKIIEPLAEWLTEATEYHSILFKRLNDIDSAKNQAQVEKKIAFETASLRDKAYYQLATIYLVENNYRKAIKYLVEVIKSQPKSETAMKSYEILQQIGFTEKVRIAQ